MLRPLPSGRLCILACLALAFAAPAVRAHAAAHYTIDARGSDGAVLTGSCRLMERGGERTIELGGALPFHYEFTGYGVSCDLTSAGAGLTKVEISRDGAVRSSSAIGGQGRIAVTVR